LFVHGEAALGEIYPRPHRIGPKDLGVVQ